MGKEEEEEGGEGGEEERGEGRRERRGGGEEGQEGGGGCTRLSPQPHRQKLRLAWPPARAIPHQAAGCWLLAGVQGRTIRPAPPGDQAGAPSSSAQGPCPALKASPGPHGWLATLGLFLCHQPPRGSHRNHVRSLEPPGLMPGAWLLSREACPELWREAEHLHVHTDTHAHAHTEHTQGRHDHPENPGA